MFCVHASQPPSPPAAATAFELLPKPESSRYSGKPASFPWRSASICSCWSQQSRPRAMRVLSGARARRLTAPSRVGPIPRGCPSAPEGGLSCSADTFAYFEPAAAMSSADFPRRGARVAGPLSMTTSAASITPGVGAEVAARAFLKSTTHLRFAPAEPARRPCSVFRSPPRVHELAAVTGDGRGPALPGV